MFIRKVRKTDPNSGKTYFYYQLVESYRTERGPRQRTLLNLGSLDLNKEELKDLANRIEDILTGVQRIIEAPEKIEKLARHYARILRVKRLEEEKCKEGEGSRYEEVDINSLKNEDVREVGNEVVSRYAYDKLGMEEILREVGFSGKEIDRAKVLIMGKLINCGSEREIYRWYNDISGLKEVMGIRLKRLTLSSLYRTSDKLLKKKEEIERELVLRERKLYGLGEKLILYDLTNTYFEGVLSTSRIGKRGYSKDKRKDRPLVTLGLIIDEEGFPKSSKIFSGDVSEVKTLKKILEEFFKVNKGAWSEIIKPTVVIDAGIVSEENLKLIKEKGFEYICVDRRRVKEEVEGEEEVVHEGKGSEVKAIRIEYKGEVYLYCRSRGRNKKEESIKEKFQKKLEEELKKLKEGLSKKGGVKRYSKVLEKIGRLKEKYSSIARYYEIKLKEEGGKVIDINWEIKDKEEFELRFSGRYKLRSSRTDLSNKELWELYNLLTRIEDSFRSLKQDLRLRPVYHRIDKRIEGHIFITLLAYHLLCVIQRGLREKGIRDSYMTIRKKLRTLVRVTTTFRTKEGKVMYIRQTSEPEPCHIEILKALGISIKGLRKRIIKTV